MSDKTNIGQNSTSCLVHLLFTADVKSINASAAVDVKAGEPMEFGCELPAGDAPPYPPVVIVYTIDGQVSSSVDPE